MFILLLFKIYQILSERISLIKSCTKYFFTGSNKAVNCSKSDLSVAIEAVNCRAVTKTKFVCLYARNFGCNFSRFSQTNIYLSNKISYWKIFCFGDTILIILYSVEKPEIYSKKFKAYNNTLLYDLFHLWSILIQPLNI